MKRNLRFLLLTSAFAFVGSALFAQTQDAAISTSADTPEPINTKALFDVEFNIDVGSAGSTGTDGLAGVAFINNQYWVSQWSTERIYILNADGTLYADTMIVGLSGTRSITSDGTNAYIGNAGSTIYQINPATLMVSGIINITTTSNAAARMCTYDPTLDNGNGGFWIGNFGSDIASVDMNGNQLSVIPAGSHNTTMYGGAYDSYSNAGNFLWISDQTAGGGQHIISQLNTSTNQMTGLTYNYFNGKPATTTAVLAGGLFITDAINVNQPSFIGLSQAQPSNILFALELVQPTGLNETSSTSFEIFPNPATEGIINIKSALSGAKDVRVFDITGKQVIQTNILNSELSVADLTNGVYFVKVTQNGQSHTEKLVIK